MGKSFLADKEDDENDEDLTPAQDETTETDHERKSC